MNLAPNLSIDVPRGTVDRLEQLSKAIREEAQAQNLVASSTLPDFWSRHILDSLQLLDHAPSADRWLDIGSGAGLPGLALAIATTDYSFVLAEPRALRAAFLNELVQRFELHGRVAVAQSKVERLAGPPFEIVSARAVASATRLFDMAAHIADEHTTWLLPKGRRASEELAEARRTWQGDFRLVPSLTDPAASILIARGVQRRTKR